MRRLLIASLAIIVALLIPRLVVPATAEVPQAMGKILIYLREETESEPKRYYQIIIVFIVNESTIYITDITGLILISYDSNSNVLTIDGVNSPAYEIDELSAFSAAILMQAYPASYIKALPSLDHVTVKFILPNSTVKTFTVNFTGLPVKETKYEGYNAIEISYEIVRGGVERVKVSIVFRDDGILLYTPGTKLVAEDDIAKKTGKQLLGTVTQSPAETPTLMPTSTPIRTSMTAIQETLTPTQSIQATTTPQETGVRLEYIAVGVVVTVIAVATALIALRRR